MNKLRPSNHSVSQVSTLQIIKTKVSSKHNSTFKFTVALLLSLFASACAQQPRATVIEAESSAHARNSNNAANHSRHSNTHTAEELETHNRYPARSKRPISTEEIFRPEVHNEQIDYSYDEENYVSENESLWPAVRNNFQLQQFYNYQRVQEVLWRYTNNQEFFVMLQPRLQKYFQYIVAETKRRRMPLEVALLPIIESSLDPFAVSSSKAKGMWQFIASTGNSYGLKASTQEEPRRDIIQATNAGLDHLQDLYKQFDDWPLALAAYNAGPGGIKRAVKASQDQGLSGDYWSLDLRTETHNYVPKILALASIIDNPSAYGVNLPAVSIAPAFESFSMSGVHNLEQLADCAGMRFDDFLQYNTRYNFVKTPRKRHIIIVPSRKTALFKSKVSNIQQNCQSRDIALAQHKMNEIYGNVNYQSYTTVVQNNDSQAPQISSTTPEPTTLSKHTHTVKPGETLWRIAYNNRVRVEDIKSWNKLSNSDLKIGTRLIIWK